MIYVKSFTINITMSQTNYVSVSWKQSNAYNMPLDEGDCHY